MRFVARAWAGFLDAPPWLQVPFGTTISTPATRSAVDDCSPAYPTVCIPPSPPDLDCPDIPFRRFTALPPDPHRFDGSDDDGIGCESG